MSDLASPLTDTTTNDWGIALHSFGCARCRAVFLLPDAIQAAACPNCGAPELAAQPANLSKHPPELFLPHAYSAAQTRPALEKFAEFRFACPDLSADNLLSRMQPVYIPMWLVDSDVIGIWEAEMGYDYQVKSAQEILVSGAWQSQEVIETRVRWEPRAGQVVRRYDNVSAPALNEHSTLFTQFADFPIAQAQPYQPRTLSQAVARVPDLEPTQAWPQAEPRVHRTAAADCQAASEAQHVRDFAVQAEFSNQNWTQLLLPVYTTWYSDDQGKQHPVYVSGSNMKVSGVRMASEQKGNTWAMSLAIIGLVIAGGSFLLSLVGFFFPLVWILSLPALLVGLLIMGAAVFPFFMPRNWNKAQRKTTAYRRIHPSKLTR